MKINIFSKLKKRLILLLMLFFLSATIAPIVAQTTPSNTSQLTQQALAAYQSQNYRSAAQLWQQAVEAYDSQADSLNQAIAWSNLALAYQQLGEWQQAQSAIETSLNILENQENNGEKQLILAQTLEIQGQLQQELGQYENALAAWQQAEELYRTTNSKEQLIQNQINQAEALQHLGLYPRACIQILSALEIDSNECKLVVDNQILWLQERTPLQAKALLSLTNIFQVSGNLTAAEELLEQILKFAPIPSELISQTQLNLANTKRALAQQPNLDSSTQSEYLQETAKYYQEALENADSVTNQTKVRLSQFSFLIETQQWQAAEDLIEPISALFEQLPTNSNAIYNQINFANHLVCLQQKNQQCSVSHQQSIEVDTSYANRIIENALQAAQTINNPRAESYAYGNLGKMYISTQPTLAQQYTEEALKIAQTIRADDIAYRWDWQLGRLLKEEKPTEAIVYYNQAYTILNNLRGDLVAFNPEIQFSFRESVEPIYREYIDLLLRDSQPSQENLIQAREAIDALQLAELDNFFRASCLEAQPVVIDQITDRDDPTSAIIYPIVLEDRFEIIVKLPQQQLRHYTTPIDNPVRVERVLQRLSQSLTQPNSSETIPLAQQVYDWIIQPVADDLASSQIKTLVFVLDSPLRNLPMSVLHNGEQYLIQQYAIATAPSLQLVTPRPLTDTEIKVLTAGLTEARGGFPPLPYVENEINTIQAQVEDTELLIDSSFTSSSFQNLITQLPFPVVHLATHGQFSSQAESTFILTWDDRINVNQLNNLLRTSSLDEQTVIELLVLSACETLRGDNRAALGMAGVAVRAGARSTLATLWRVNDEATAQLMGQFYQRLANQTTPMSKAEALRQAQLSLLQDSRFRRPHFWSPYVLLGNWL